MDKKDVIGQRVAKIRLNKKYTQESFAHVLGVKRSHIADTERGKTFPNIEFMEKLHNIFQIDLNNLICGTGKTKTTAKSIHIVEEGGELYGNEKLIELYEEIRKLLKENTELKIEIERLGKKQG